MSGRQVQLNQELARKTLAADVLAIVRDSVDEFNLVNCGTALQRLAKCPDTHRHLSPTASTLPGVPRVLQEQFARLLDAAAALVRKDPRHVESRQLASMLWACGKLELGNRAADLVKGIEAASMMHASKFNPQELANAVWGAAKLGLDPSRSELVHAIADAIAVSLPKAPAAPSGPRRDPKGGGPGGWRGVRVEWTSQGVSNVAMSLAKLDADVTHGEGVSTTGDGFKYGKVFGEVCSAVTARADDFNPQEVANILHALAKLTAGDGEGDGGGRTVPGPVERTAREAAEALASRITIRWIEAQRLEPQHVANMSWACAKMGAAGGDDLAGALAKAAANLAPRMNTQELSMVAWSAAAFGSGRWPADCAETVARAFGDRATDATPRQLAKASMAYAKLGTLHPKLMDAVADAVLALEQPFAASLNPQDVANLAWSFSKLGCKKKRLFDALSAAFVAHLRDDDDSFSSQQLTMIVCAFGLLGFKDEGVLNAAMGAMSKERVAEFNPRDLTNTAWALAALGVNAEAKPKLVERIGRTARKRLDDFNSQELLKFLGAFERLGGSDVRLARAVSKQRILSYEFPALSTHVPSSSSVKLSSKTPTSYQGTDRVRVDDSCGGWGRGNTGVALWEGSFVLAEWLSRQGTPTGSPEMAEVMRGAWGPNESGGWRGMTGVELGAGLGLPSIVASKLGLEMVATDGDDEVLELLSQNIGNNTSPDTGARVSRLVWGCDEPLEYLGLSEPPKLILASDVVYGNDPKKWKLLVKTMCDLSGPSTLVVIGNVQRYPVHHPMAETKFFSEATAVDFERTEVPVTSLHPDFRRTGGGACVVHLFRRRPESLKRARSESDLGERKVKKAKKEKKAKKAKKKDSKKDSRS